MYLIRKDGLWLLGFQPSGSREFVNGALTEVYTAIWGNDIHDAKGYEQEETAQVYADLFGGDVILVSVKQTGKEDEKE
jgi:hypothetical protein